MIRIPSMPTPAEVATALRRVDDDYDQWLAVRTPLSEKPILTLIGVFVNERSLTLDQFSDMTDCYMFALRHGWAEWERKHGETPTRPTGDQAAVYPSRWDVMTLLDFRIDGEDCPQPPKYWLRLAGWTRSLNLADIYCAAFRHGWFLRGQGVIQ